MKTLNQIKNEYAVSKGYKDFDDLLICVINYEILSEQINEVMKIYAMECLKLASENAELFDINSHSCIGDTYYGNTHQITIDKESIISENNIIK